MLLNTYINGNSQITFDESGTRVITFQDELQLDTPLNIDIKVSSKCSLGYNPKTNTSFCDFCHESNRTDGSECDYNKLKTKLQDLPPGIELAIGSNNLSEDLVNFLLWCKGKNFFCNVTINQGHLLRDQTRLSYCIDNKLIKGLGVSYRSSLKWNVPEFILNYENTVFHVIMGIDDITDILSLKGKGVKKVLTLGEKDFGFNLNRVDLTTLRHKQWYWWVNKLYSNFDVVSFDNLALQQLNLKRFFKDKDWEVFNQGEHSLYINSVEGYLAPSSHSNEKMNWDDTTIRDFFKQKIK